MNFGITLIIIGAAGFGLLTIGLTVLGYHSKRNPDFRLGEEYRARLRTYAGAVILPTLLILTGLVWWGVDVATM